MNIDCYVNWTEQGAVRTLRSGVWWAGRRMNQTSSKRPSPLRERYQAHVQRPRQAKGGGGKTRGDGGQRNHSLPLLEYKQKRPV